MSKGKANSDEETPTFENAMSDLEAIVRKLETGTQPLDQMLTEYARAVELVQHCHKHLNSARRRISELESVRSDGTAVVHDWDDSAPVVRESTTPPARRRKS
ncbi:MAG: exodeoxyribonuclease VII small subunit [Pirellula sp.]|jgi:exodeoxyribonuclease VII small subunit|nr:exodeoxyribonuclease VII small subunit [Pirellula sp.]